MSIHRCLGLALASSLFLAAEPAQAQSFLENMARRAVDRATGSVTGRAEQTLESVVGSVVSRVQNAASSNTEGQEPVREVDPTANRTTPEAAVSRVIGGPAPWPLNAADALYWGDWEFDPVFAAQHEALDEFSKVDCFGCEGGYSYDSWINHHMKNIGEGGVPGMVGRLAIGESLSWRGNEATGRLEILSDHPIGDFPCKQVRTVMTRGDRTAEALGLYCKGKGHAYDRDGWAAVIG